MRRKEITNVLDHWRLIHTRLRDLKLVKKSRSGRKEINDTLKELHRSYKKARQETDIVAFMKNTVGGIFDGLADKPMDKSYLRVAVKRAMKRIDKIIKEWEQTLESFKVVPQEPVDFGDEKDWRKQLEMVKNKFEGGESTETVSSKEEVWDEEDETALDDFLNTEIKLLSKKRGIIKAPVIITQWFNKRLTDELTDNNYVVENIFGGQYTLVKNMTLYGVSEELEERYETEMALMSYIMKSVNKRKKQLTIASGSVKRGKHHYYILVPKSMPQDFMVDEWAFGERTS